MKPIIYRIPLRTWVDIRDPEVIAELVALINGHIAGAQDDGVEISVLSRLDDGAPKQLEAAPPGHRHFQVDMSADGAQLRFIVGVLGRPGSELLGYSADELRAASGALRKVVAALAKGRRITAGALAAVRDAEMMLDAPSTDPRRCQPIEPADFIVASVYAEPTEVSA